MSEESAAPDPVELARQAFAAVNRRDLDALMSLYAPEAVLDMTRTIGFAPEGRAAVRGFIEEWMSSYDELEWMPEELLDLGSGVVFVVVSQTARPVGVTGYVKRRDGWVFVFADGLLSSHTAYFDHEIDEARAAAKRLAQERA